MPKPAAGQLFPVLITAIFVLRLAAQVAVTPLGEGLDFFRHMAYVVFMAEEGRAPRPDEPAMPDWVDRLDQTVPGPDFSAGAEAYRAWAALGPAAQAQARAALNADLTTHAYPRSNGQAQHPPLYYWLLSGVYRAFPPGWGLEARVYWLTLVSVFLAALAVPGFYKTLRLYLDETPARLALLALVWYPNSLPFLGRITNDTLALPLMVWGLYFCLRARASQQPRHLTAAGVLLGLACFTKSYALTLLPLYLVCAVAGERRLNWRGLLVAGPLTALSLGALFTFNLTTTGHLIPLAEMRWTAAVPLAARLAALVQVDAVWFVGGLVKGFWWLGYWSFVSTGWVYYLPLAALGYLLVAAPRRGGAWPERFALRDLWPHYAALALFVAGMLWHAALFSLAARLAGQSVHSGNEGWYLNVLLGSAAVIVAVLLERRLTAAAFQRALAGLVLFMMGWGAVALGGMAAFWGGAAEVSGQLRAVGWNQLFAALLDPRTWANWHALPGVLQPVGLTSLLPLVLAMAGTAWAWQRLALRPAQLEPAAAAVVDPARL